MFSFDSKPEINFAKIEQEASLDGHNSNIPTDGGLPNSISQAKNSSLIYRDKQLESAQSELHHIQESVDTELGKIKESGVKNAFLLRLTHLLAFNIEQVSLEISQKKQDFNQRNLDFIKFRKLHQLGMMPIRADRTMSGTYALIAILLIIEASMNAIAFKEIGGLLTAYTLSISQALVNILTCYIVGSKILGGVFHKKGGARALSGAIFMFHIVFIVWLNLALGLYRAISVNDPMASVLNPEQLKIALMPFIHLNEYEMSSALVAVVGLVLALLAYLKGYYSDDPYPGYGERYRIAYKSRDELIKFLSEVHEKLISIEKEFSDACVQVHAYGTGGINQWSGSLNSLEKIFVDYQNILKILSEEYTRCQKVYFQNFQATFVSDHPGATSQMNLDNDLFPKPDFDLKIVFSDAYQYFLTDDDRQIQREILTKEFDKNNKTMRDEFSNKIKFIKQRIDILSSENQSLSIGKQEPS